jgi:voltage-gated potassium channel
MIFARRGARGSRSAMSDPAKNSPAHPRISALRVVFEMAKVMWHLWPLFLLTATFFFALSLVMYLYGGLVNTLDHTPVNFGEALYMCGVTGLTIGYGDFVPTTAIGRVTAIGLAFIGVTLMGLITSVAVLAVQRAVTVREITER